MIRSTSQMKLNDNVRNGNETEMSNVTEPLVSR